MNTERIRGQDLLTIEVDFVESLTLLDHVSRHFTRFKEFELRSREKHECKSDFKIGTQIQKANGEILSPSDE